MSPNPNRSWLRICRAFACLLLVPAVYAQLAVTDLDKAWQDDLKLGQKFQREGRPEIAEELLLRALKNAEKIGEDSLPAAACLNALAILYHSQRNPAAAEPLYQRALSIVEAKAGPDHPRAGVLRKNLGELYGSQGRLTDALEQFRAAFKITESQLPEQDAGLVEPLRGLAELEFRLGLFDESAATQGRVLLILKHSVGINDPATIRCLSDLGVIKISAGRLNEAERWIREAIEAGEAAWGTDDPRLGRTLVYQADIWRYRLQLAEAEALLARSIAISGIGQEDENPALAMALNNLAELQATQRHYDHAEELYERSIHVWARVAGLEDPEVGTGLYNLGSMYREQQRYPKAEECYKRALDILKTGLGAEDPRVKKVAGAYAEMLTALGRGEEAQEIRTGAAQQSAASEQADH